MQFVFWYFFAGLLVSLYMCLHDGVSRALSTIEAVILILFMLALWPVILANAIIDKRRSPDR